MKLYVRALERCQHVCKLYVSHDVLLKMPSPFIDLYHRARADYLGTQYRARMHSPQAGYEIWTNAFDGYYKFGLLYVTMLHPQIIGKPGMIMLFDRLINYIKKFPDVWFATAEDVARHWIRIGR